MKTLSNPSIKLSLLRRHLQTNHPEKKNRDPHYFKRLGESAKKQRVDNTGKQYQQSVGMITFSYEIARTVAKNKEPRTIGEELIMPAAKVLVKHVIGDEAALKLNSVSLSRITIQQRYTEMSININEQVLLEAQSSNMNLPCKGMKQRTCRTAHSF